MTGCMSKTDHGKCVGLDEPQDPALEYKLSARNILIGIIFIQLIVPPVLVVTDQLYCPIGKVKQ